MKPTDKEVRINFDDELSQVVPNTTNYQEQITKHITFSEVDLPKPAADIFSQTKNSQSISPSAQNDSESPENVFNAHALIQTKASQQVVQIESEQAVDVDMQEESQQSESQEEYDGTYAQNNLESEEDDSFSIESPPPIIAAPRQQIHLDTKPNEGLMSEQRPVQQKEDLNLIEYANQREKMISENDEEDLEFMHRRGNVKPTPAPGHK